MGLKSTSQRKTPSWGWILPWRDITWMINSRSLPRASPTLHLSSIAPWGTQSIIPPRAGMRSRSPHLGPLVVVVFPALITQITPTLSGAGKITAAIHTPGRMLQPPPREKMHPRSPSTRWFCNRKRFSFQTLLAGSIGATCSTHLLMISNWFTELQQCHRQKQQMLRVGLSTAAGSVADGSSPENQAAQVPDGRRGLSKILLKDLLTLRELLFYAVAGQTGMRARSEISDLEKAPKCQCSQGKLGKKKSFCFGQNIVFLQNHFVFFVIFQSVVTVQYETNDFQTRVTWKWKNVNICPDGVKRAAPTLSRSSLTPASPPSVFCFSFYEKSTAGESFWIFQWKRAGGTHFLQVPPISAWLPSPTAAVNFPLLEILNIKTGCFSKRQIWLRGRTAATATPHAMLPAALFVYRNVQPSVTDFSWKPCFPPNGSLVLPDRGVISSGRAGPSLKHSCCFPALPACTPQHCSIPSQSSCPDVPVLQMCSTTANLQQPSLMSPQSWHRGCGSGSSRS